MAKKAQRRPQRKNLDEVAEEREFAASILDDDTARKHLNKLASNESDSTAWKAFKLIAAYKRGSPDQRRFFDTALTDEQEREMWWRFLQSKSQTVAREALRRARQYGVVRDEGK